MLCQFQNGVKHFCTSNIKKVSNFFPRRSNIQQRFSFSRQFQFLKNQLLFVLKTSDCRTISTQSTCVCTLSVHTIRKVKFMIGGGLVAKNDRPFFLTPTVFTKTWFLAIAHTIISYFIQIILKIWWIFWFYGTNRINILVFWHKWLSCIITCLCTSSFYAV